MTTRFATPYCPKCNCFAQGVKVQSVGVDEVVFTGDDGEFEYEGGPVWNDSKESVKGMNGGVILVCADCPAEWESRILKTHGPGVAGCACDWNDRKNPTERCECCGAAGGTPCKEGEA